MGLVDYGGDLAAAVPRFLAAALPWLAALGTVPLLLVIRAAPRGDAENTYQAGVKAALDVVRRLGFPYADTGADNDGGTGADD